MKLFFGFLALIWSNNLSVINTNECPIHKNNLKNCKSVAYKTEGVKEFSWYFSKTVDTSNIYNTTVIAICDMQGNWCIGDTTEFLNMLYQYSINFNKPYNPDDEKPLKVKLH